MTAAAGIFEDMSIARSWRVHGAALLLLVLFIGLSFFDSVEDVIQVWWISPAYSHCFLIIPISAWLVWEKRDVLSRIRPVVELRVLWAVPVLLLLWWMADLATINEARQFAIVGLVQVAIAAMLGLRVYRQIWFAALYLFFLVPAGQYLVAPMQRFAAAFADMVLTFSGVAHHTEGTLIELTNGTFEVAEACAGLRFLIATVALGVLFAYMMFRKWYKIVLFLLACIVIPLIGNGLRVAGIILLAHFTSNQYGVGADHLVYGWGFNVAILLLVLALGSFFRDHIKEAETVVPESGAGEPLPKIALAFGAMALLIFIGPAAARWQQERPIQPHVSGLLGALNIPGWRTADIVDDWRPDYRGADARLLFSLAPNGSPPAPPVDAYVVYYARAQAAHALTAHKNLMWNSDVWTLNSSGNAMARLAGRTIALQESIITSPAGRRIVWSCYWIDGRFTTSPFAVKLLQIPAALSGREGQAMVAVSTAVDSTDVEARARLSQALLALKDLPARLDSVNSSPSQ